jgi:diguanylate cyclase (GGDEF)-like protein
LILLDLMMPELGGIEVCRILKQDLACTEIPIIFISANSDRENIVRAFECGAVDYVKKPFRLQELLARVKLHLELKKTRDVLQEATNRLEQTVLTDYLTGVPNRRAIFAFGQQEFSRASRYHRHFSILVFDIDHFKSINDLFGHSAGDRVLLSVARTIRERLRSVDGFGRWGGEEFIAILPETTLENARTIARRICQDIENLKISIEGQETEVTLSVGVASFDPGDTGIENALERADSALFSAKKQGRARVVAYRDGGKS